MHRRRVIFSLAAMTGATGYMLALGAWRSGAAAPRVKGVPLPLTAMEWELTDHRHGTVTPADWVGRPAMVFFGFTHCPDVCPTTLLDIADWLAELGPEAEGLTTALITVDPARDTPQLLAEYVENFDARILALSGSEADTARVTDAFAVTAERVPVDGGDYTMNHTAGVFLFRADGSFAGTIDFHEDRRFALPKLRRILTPAPGQATS